MKNQITRRQFLYAFSGMMALSGGGGFYSFCVEPYHPEVTRITLPCRNLPASFEGFTCAHLTDIHHGPVVSLEYIERCVEQTNSLAPDMVLLTGDYVSRSPRYIAPCAEALSYLKAPMGIYAVPGNHDYWVDIAQMKRCLKGAGISFLVNRHVPVDRKGERIYIVGLDELWTGWPHLERATRGIPDNAVRIVLMHNPDLFPDIASASLELVLAGHTHGGQVDIPFFGPIIIPSRYGNRYARGFSRLQGSTMYVNRGIGLATPAVRFRCPPEIALFTLTGA